MTDGWRAFIKLYANRHNQSDDRRKAEGIFSVRRCRNRETAEACRRRVQKISSNDVHRALRAFACRNGVAVSRKGKICRDHNARDGEAVSRFSCRNREMRAGLPVLRRERRAIRSEEHTSELQSPDHL